MSKRIRPPAIKNPPIIKNPCGIDIYEPMKSVLNICPRCENEDYMELRYVYDDEGKKVCRNCRNIENDLTDEEWSIIYGKKEKPHE